MSFLKLPFKLVSDDEITDPLLVQYLKDNPVAYLSEETQKAVSELHKKLDDTNPPDKKSLISQREELLKLWPAILTDAVRELKKNDDREWPPNDGNIKYETFFHAGSLGIDELKILLEKFAEFEGMLYGASPGRYRDHIAHAFRVWVIGHVILLSDECFNGKLFADELFEQGISSSEWQCMWAITALCHDLGYPLSEIDTINALARDSLQGMGLVHGGDLRFTFSQQMLPFEDTVIKMMASRPVERHIHNGQRGGAKKYTTHLQSKYYLKFLKSFTRLEHGVVSSLLVGKAMVYFLESDLALDEHAALGADDAKQFLIRREILRAMATHTCPDIYHPRFDTLAFLLYLTDELQCWGRPTLEQLEHNVVGVHQGDAEIRAFNDDKVHIVIRTDEDGWSDEQIAETTKQLDKLYRRLRLAVHTEKLKGRHLRFAVAPANGVGVQLELKDGSIALDKMQASKL